MANTSELTQVLLDQSGCWSLRPFHLGYSHRGCAGGSLRGGIRTERSVCTARRDRNRAGRLFCGYSWVGMYCARCNHLIRATGIGWGMAIGRGGQVVAPLVAGQVIAATGDGSTMLLGLPATLLISIFLSSRSGGPALLRMPHPVQMLSRISHRR
jgi:hypothetical protein